MQVFKSEKQLDVK